MTQIDPRIQRRIERERAGRKLAEQLLEEKSLELFNANQRLQDAHDELEERVRQRTRELEEVNRALAVEISERTRAQSELAHARDDALKASRLKSEFLANMSHEIRTPMNAIIGLTNLLLETELTFEQNDFLSTINASSEALLTIINDILDFSRIEANKLELDYHPFSVRDCIEEAIDLLAQKAYGKGLELAYIMEPPIPEEYIGDISRLRQILVNLLNNAIKFTEEGEVIVSVSAASLVGQHHELHFSVKDTGIGIPEDRMHRLFNSFSQVDASTTRKYGGTGLGLAISKQLSELMGGRIWVESDIGQGSNFQFTIQLEAVERKNQPLQKVQELLNGKQLLIVDDNPTNCLILKRQTEAWGMQVTARQSGQAALELLQEKNDFDIALIDMQMPEMDGVMLAQKLRADYKHIKFPMLMLSSIGGRPAEVDSSLFVAYASKPVKPSTLRRGLIQGLSDQSSIKSNTHPENEEAAISDEIPYRILLVEDNMVNQKVAKKMFDRLGYRVDISSNGIEALSALRLKTYDLIFMDVQMPEMDGLEATKYVHAEWGKDRPFIIAMTANAMVGDREKFINAGMDDYISKPVRLDDLKAMLFKTQTAIKAERKVSFTSASLSRSIDAILETF